MKNPNLMSIQELKAYLFDLQTEVNVCMQILSQKIQDEAKTPPKE